MKMRWIILFLGVIHAAQTFSEERIELKTLIEEVRERNPDISAARERQKSARARIPQMRSLPNPMVSFLLKNEEMETMRGVSLSQTIPFPGKLYLQGEMAERATNMAEEMVRMTELEVLSQLRVAYYDLSLVYHHIQIVEKNKDLLEKLARTAEVRYAVGKAIQQDVLKAQVEVSRLLEELAILHQKKESLVAEINRLRNRSVDAPLGRPAELGRGELKSTLEELTQMAMENNPLLKGSLYSIEENSKGLSLSRQAFIPDLSLMGSRMTGGMRDTWEFSVGMEVPLYFWTKEGKGVEEARANLDSARMRYEAMRQEVLFRVKDLYLKAITADRLTDLLGEGIIPQASLSLESAIAGYEGGKVDFLTLLDNLITLLETEMEYYEELNEFQNSFAELEAVVGIEIITD